MMNKGFELIEACHLFGVTPDKVEIVIHRQSIVHSAVEFTDNAVIAQMGVPDMTVPIQLAITYPERYPSTAKPLSLTDIGTLTFAKPDSEVFTPLAAAYRAALCPENTSGAIINAANEVLVHRFLSGEIPFIRILDGVASVLDRIKPRSSLSIENIIEADRETREITLHE
jgi:1-deoxy-D-xylulose-5-phosphate reductoisomerase